VHEVLAGFGEPFVQFTEDHNEIAEVFVNGQAAGKLTLPSARKLGAPLTLDLARFVTTGAQTVEIRRASKRYASAQLVTSHYQPWSAAKATDLNRSLRLAVHYDQTQFKLGGEVTCRVEAERITSNGGGMLLAEIGLPPGAEVERASLEQAKNAPLSGLDQYDVLPDRVVLYLWPRAGGVKLSFKFRPRFGIKAQSEPSLIYDYYNPAALVTVAPTRFVVQ
jgi:hypothetical protein